MYSRDIDGQVLTFTTSGFTYNSQHVLYDIETGGLWFHLWDSNNLTCISGPLSGRVLRAVPDQHAGDWVTWKETHTNTKYMKPLR